VHYPNLRKDANGDYWYTSTRGQARLYGGKLLENICQALARIILANVEVTMYKYGVMAQLQVYDELVFVVKEQYVERVSVALEKLMTAPVPWLPDLPLACEIGVGDNYGECK